MLVEDAINPLKDIFFQSMIYLQAIMTPINKITLPVSLQLGRSSSERTAYSILIKPKYDSLIQKKDVLRGIEHIMMTIARLNFLYTEGIRFCEVPCSFYFFYIVFGYVPVIRILKTESGGIWSYDFFLL